MEGRGQVVEGREERNLGGESPGEDEGGIPVTWGQDLVPPVRYYRGNERKKVRHGTETSRQDQTGGEVHVLRKWSSKQGAFLAGVGVGHVTAVHRQSACRRALHDH